MNEDKAISAEQLEQIQDANGTFISLARWILDLIGIDKASDIVATLIMVIITDMAVAGVMMMMVVVMALTMMKMVVDAAENTIKSVI